ncbi:MAG TPA: hypothetical protein VEZ17_03030 [Chitinophagaceae bacterium]|nr:hypothetical protein [Chitinophagaceae bacterium]
MKLEGDLYSITSINAEHGTVKAELSLHANNRIFEGHFPGLPVLPGVCQMQMIKEITEMAINKKTRMTRADNMKFLAVINPLEQSVIEVELTYTTGEPGSIYVNATMTANKLPSFKFRGLFVEV